MNKKITIELTQEEYDALAKLFEQAKSSPIMPSKALNFDDFCKEIIIAFTKGPDLSSLKDLNLDDLMGQLGDLSQIKDMLSGIKKDMPKKEENKKEEIPDDQKYKS